jgi:hypothetical protein
LTDRRLASPKQLYDTLHGRLTDHHRFMLKLYLSQYDALDAASIEIDQQVDAAIAHMDAEVEAGHATFRSLISLLSTMPGVSALSATTIPSEIGTDMSRFAQAGQLVARAGLCPDQNESAGKRKSSRLRKGAPLAENDTRSVRLVSRQEEGQLLQSAVQPATGSRWGEESDLRRGRLHAHRHLPHAQERRQTP